MNNIKSLNQLEGNLKFLPPIACRSAVMKDAKIHTTLKYLNYISNTNKIIIRRNFNKN
jgi:hypothetical protein